MASFDPNVPYNDLPALPPPLEQVETPKILKKCINARVALAELRQAAELIPNAAVLVNALPLLEARLREARFELEGRRLEIDALHEKVRALEMLARNAATSETIDDQLRRLSEQSRQVERLEALAREKTDEPPPDH